MPDISKPVLEWVNWRLGRNNRCILYSVGPSCGSASRLVTTKSGSAVPSTARESGAGLGDDLFLGVEVLGVDHGEDTRGGSS
jgi:hypothetical protein